MQRGVIVSATLLVWLAATAVVAIAQVGPDELYAQCKDHPRGPWCYQETVAARNQPELCENILTYWPKADGVHGWCYFQLAPKNKD